MRIALALREKTLATVADFADRLRVVEAAGDGWREVATLPWTGLPRQRIDTLIEQEIGWLFCGSLSRDLIDALIGTGLRVRSELVGQADELLAQWRRGAEQLGRPPMDRCRRRAPNPSSDSVTPVDRPPQRIAIAVDAPEVDARIEGRFARAHWFALIDRRPNSYAFFANPFAVDRRPSGRRSAHFVIGLGVDMVIAGRFGDDGQRTLTRHDCRWQIAPAGGLAAAHFAELHDRTSAPQPPGTDRDRPAPLQERTTPMSIIIAMPLADGQLCAHFGHAPSFAFVTIDESEQIIACEERSAPEHHPGSIPRWLHDAGANIVLAGGMGARAITSLQRFGVRSVLGVPSLPPKEAAARFLAGAFEHEQHEHVCQCGGHEHEHGHGQRHGHGHGDGDCHCHEH